MNACDFSAFSKFDVGACLHQLAFGWVPDWFWLVLPWWPWVVIIGGLGMAYRFAGWPGVVAFATGIGFIFGRQSVKHSDPVEHVDGKDAAPPVRKPKKSKDPVTRKSRETVSDWFKRMTGE